MNKEMNEESMKKEMMEIKMKEWNKKKTKQNKNN